MDSRQIEYLKLITSHQAALHGYIRSIAPGAAIDDILQEVNVVLWERADTFEPGTHFKAFAFRIAHLKTLEALRRQKRGQWLIFDSDLLETIAKRHSQDTSPALDPQAALRGCLESLAEDDRELLHRRYTRQEPVRRIASSCKRTEGSLQQHFFRLRNQLRDCIERRLADTGGGA